MVEQKILINPSDIRTMRKDIKQLRRFGVLEGLKQETKAVEKDTMKEQSLQKYAKEKEAMEKILSETARQRSDLKNPTFSSETATNQQELKEETTTNKSQEEKAWLRQMPEATKEKIKTAGQNEQEKRRRFMEDIERWASKSNENHNEQRADR